MIPAEGNAMQHKNAGSPWACLRKTKICSWKLFHRKLQGEHSLMKAMAGLGVQQGRNFITDPHWIFFPDEYARSLSLSLSSYSANKGWKYLACKLALHVDHDMNNSISAFLKESHVDSSKYLRYQQKEILFYFIFYLFYKLLPSWWLCSLDWPSYNSFCP